MKAGWKTVKLGELARIISGRNQREVESPNGPHPIIGSGGEMGRAHETLCPAETTVVGRKGSINRPFFMTEAFWNVDTAFGISADKNVVTPKFLHYFCLSFDFTTLNKGTTIPSLVKSDIAEIEIPLPPLAEQKRIVALLDEAFAGINEAKAKAEVNLENAGMLFKGHVQMIFEEGANGWKNVTIEEISTNLDSKRVPITKSIRTSGEFPYYGASGIVDYVESYLFEGDNLLVSEDGANLLARSTPIAFSVTGKYWVNNHAHILHFENMATQRFAEFYLESIKLDGYITGAAQPKLTQKALNSIPIPIPDSLQKQAEIVRSIESLHRETEMLTKIYERKMGALNELRTALLTQAFAGELTA
jgi:type I restriction enzyme S subunit